MPGNPKERQHRRCESVLDGAPEALTHSFWAGPQRWPTPDERYEQFAGSRGICPRSMVRNGSVASKRRVETTRTTRGNWQREPDPLPSKNWAHEPARRRFPGEIRTFRGAAQRGAGRRLIGVRRRPAAREGGARRAPGAASEGETRRGARGLCRSCTRDGCSRRGGSRGRGPRLRGSVSELARSERKPPHGDARTAIVRHHHTRVRAQHRHPALTWHDY